MRGELTRVFHLEMVHHSESFHGVIDGFPLEKAR